MTTFKKAQVVLLYCDSGSLIIDKSMHLLYEREYDIQPTLDDMPDYMYPHHLYIVNDDEIKPNDWFINLKSNKLFKCTKEFRDTKLGKTIGCIRNDDNLRFELILGDAIPKKIIATTDKSLKLPTVSDAFIAYYIEKYNNQKPITDVLVEYENDILKIHSNNSIFAKNPKDSWSREEIEVLLFKYAEENALTSTKSEIDDFNQWIENNL